MEHTAIRLSILAALIVGALSMVGVPLIGIPILMLLGALGISFLEIHHQAEIRVWRRPIKTFWYSLATASIFVLIWLAYNVFAVDMKIRFITGGAVAEANPREYLRFAVQLTNRGRPTSLTNWRAEIMLPSGKLYKGHINSMIGDSVEVVGSDRRTTNYLLPDCDLSFETARAMQTGDSVFGIVEFVFDMQAGEIPARSSITMAATDMLGRAIKGNTLYFADVNKMEPEVFPCRMKQTAISSGNR